MIDERAIGERFRAVAGLLDERQRRVWAAAEARSHGRGGIAAVARASGLAENTIRKGLAELDAPHDLPAGRVRKAGAGPKRRTDTDKTLLADLKRLVDGDTRGDPERPLLWTSKSVRELAKGLRELGHEVSYRTVARLLHELGFSLQANRKTKEGSQHPDRDAQFRHINHTVTAAIKENRPAISIDTKKKELVGEYKNGGREWRPAGDPVAVNVHDFPDKTLGKAIPYGIYDIGANNGFVNVGITKETAAFAVASIRSWWQQLGHVRYPDATILQITADCGGGGNGNRVRLWKTELQRLADDTGLQISVCHFPPGTSKWNKSAWAVAHQGVMKCCGRSVGRGRRLDSGAQLCPQQVWCRAAGPRIVAASTNPRFGSYQGLSPAGRSSTPSGRRQSCSRSMIASPGSMCIATASSRASVSLAPGAA